ncbi:hypothetical protein FEM48_Zijuj05G0038900 [Ziziphus jujuba var. spinosa]|uniref:Uncharacterized protein n=1 Tax=Ziziphus jujuba var. spinosa TaxID=714518 RepID=A0A978VCN9_ZIZJJ|nr:PR5-like receptor kinase [Ziziphus jujuba var. spinosa]KAH7528128.1 hypothetical protein FEM48_Zijuj05G0038900 [Ziziphus jujuba var. spinosa]
MKHCSHQVWPVALSNAGEPSLLPSKGGHIPVLHPGQSINISVSPSLSVAIGGRTPCTKDSDERKLRSLNEDSGSHTEGGGCEISYNLQQPISTTIATFMLNGTDGLDHYEVSFRNSYNLPMLVVPVHDGNGSGSGGHCRTAGCRRSSGSAKRAWAVRVLVKRLAIPISVVLVIVVMEQA